MLANNNKSVAVSGGHIPSYSNRWAILTGLSMSLSICPSVSLSRVSRLSSSTPVIPSQTRLPAVFIPHMILLTSVQMHCFSAQWSPAVAASPLVFVSSPVWFIYSFIVMFRFQ